MAKGVDSGLVDIEVSGDQRTVELMMEGLERAFGPEALTHDFLEERVLPLLRERAESRFASEGDDVSGAWAQLKPMTQAMRQKGGFGPAHPINVRTGQMKRHILDRAPDAVPNSLGGTLWFPKRGGAAKAVSKVRTAQVGDGGRTVPRPVLGVNERDLELMLIAFSTHVADYQPGGAQGMFS